MLTGIHAKVDVHQDRLKDVMSGIEDSYKLTCEIVCVCVRVCVHACVHVCVCVCERERERGVVLQLQGNTSYYVKSS